MSPTYEYRCQACGNEEEHAVSSVKDKDRSFSCMKCGALLTKVFSVPSAILFDFPSIKVQNMMDKEIRNDKKGRLK